MRVHESSFFSPAQPLAHRAYIYRAAVWKGEFPFSVRVLANEPYRQQEKVLLVVIARRRDRLA